MLTPPPCLFPPIQNSGNATLFFKASDSVTMDVNGYPIITSTEIIIRARLYTETGRKAEDIYPDGVELKGELMWGRLHDPISFPTTVKDLAIAEVNFDDGRTGYGRVKIKTQNAITNGAVIGQYFSLLFRGS